MSVILGMDLGPSSIGWALVDNEKNFIISSGVRIFQEGVNKINTSEEMSKNATRREKREIRVQARRRKLRRAKLVRAMKDLNFIDLDKKSEFFSIDPYLTRRKALYEPLTLLELARVFYHISKRRGFKSNRKDEVFAETEEQIKKEKEKSIVKSSINTLQGEIENGGFKTLGEYLSTLNPHEQRIRDRYTHRDMYIQEFDLIWETQKLYHPEVLNEENYNLIRNKILFFQRPLKSQRHKVGFCPFEPNKHKTPKSSPLFQEFRMLQQVNSLTISGGQRMSPEEIKITPKERKILIDYLSINPSLSLVTTKTFRTLLGLDKKIVYNINLATNKKLDGLKTNYSIRKAIGEKRFNKLSEDEKFKMWDLLYFASDKEWLKENAKKKWNFDEETAEKFSSITLEDKFGSLSTKAINKIMPGLKEGLLYYEACEKAGYKHSLWDKSIDIKDLLDEPEDVRNPIVMQTLNQVRKVVNDIIEKHDLRPEIIRVELGRDLKIPLQKRIEIDKNNRKKESENKEIIEILIREFPISNPSRDDIVKYKLWVECKFTCPYTGRPIGKEQLFGTKEFEVEHIIPYSISLDNSFNNKTLCDKRANNDKGKDIPYDYFMRAGVSLEEVKERIKDLPKPKKMKFLQKEVPEEKDFISRMLNDNRYASKLAVDYLKQITPNVTSSNGQATSLVRHYWGLNSILAKKDEDENIKNREDHRHHAVDALIVAMTDRSKLQRLSTFHGSDRINWEDLKNKEFIRKHFPAPWESFRKDAQESISNIIVSFRVNKKVNGPLHEETFYGKLYNPDGSEKTDEKGYPIFTYRKKIETLTQNEVMSIVDQEVQNAVLERLQELGVDTDKKKFDVPKNAFADDLCLIGKKTGKKTKIKTVRIMRTSSAMIKPHDYNLWVEPGNNHHIVIYNENGKVQGKVVTLYQAFERRKMGLPIIDRELGADKEFMSSLAINELVIWGSIPEDFNFDYRDTYHLVFDNIYRVQKMVSTNKQVFFRKHNVAIVETKDKEGNKIKPGLKSAYPTTLNCTKIRISPSGLIEPAYD